MKLKDVMKEADFSDFGLDKHGSELDVDDDGKIEAEDFAKLRKGLRDKDVGEDAEDEDDKKKTENLKRMVREEILAALR